VLERVQRRQPSTNREADLGSHGAACRVSNGDGPEQTVEDDKHAPQDRISLYVMEQMANLAVLISQDHIQQRTAGEIQKIAGAVIVEQSVEVVNGNLQGRASE